jgi:hypothetical protein
MAVLNATEIALIAQPFLLMELKCSLKLSRYLETKTFTIPDLTSSFTEAPNNKSLK